MKSAATSNSSVEERSFFNGTIDSPTAPSNGSILTNSFVVTTTLLTMRILLSDLNIYSILTKYNIYSVLDKHIKLAIIPSL